MRIHHLDCATLCPFGGRLVSGEGPLLACAELVCHCLLIETDHQGLVLVDTGIGLADVANPRSTLGLGFELTTRPVLDVEQTAARAVERLGFARKDVRHIVLTHADLDHAGGLPDFPHAKVHVTRDEHDAVVARATFKEKERYRLPHFAHGPAWETYTTTGEPWFGFGAVRSLVGLPPEILLIPLAGHTRGHAAVAVKDGDGWLLHAGDAYFSRHTVDPSSPTAPAMDFFERLVALDYARVRTNHERLRELHARHGHEVRIFCAHDPREMPRAQTSAS